MFLIVDTNKNLFLKLCVPTRNAIHSDRHQALVEVNDSDKHSSLVRVELITSVKSFTVQAAGRNENERKCF